MSVLLPDGCGWRNYLRDIALDRRTDSLRDGICCLLRILRHLLVSGIWCCADYQSLFFCVYAVNVILPVYRYLQRHKWQGLLGALGPTIYICACMETSTFHYSDFKIGRPVSWYGFNQITLGLVLWWAARATRAIFLKLVMALSPVCGSIRLPINLTFQINSFHSLTYRFAWKPHPASRCAGNWISSSVFSLPVVILRDWCYAPFCKKCSASILSCRITEVHDAPYARYQQLMDDADVQLDQLYSVYLHEFIGCGKGSNGSEAVSRELWDIEWNRTSSGINVPPDEQDIYQKLEDMCFIKSVLNYRRKYWICSQVSRSCEGGLPISGLLGKCINHFFLYFAFAITKYCKG